MSRDTTSSEDVRMQLFITELGDWFNAARVLEYVSKCFYPEDVYDDTALRAWAKRNGYSREDGIRKR